jgi:ribosomal protein L11 methyltransferase
MKHYIQFEISGTAPEVTEIVIAMLSAFGFNGFEERENLLLATGQQGEVEAEEAGLWLNEQQISYRQTQMAEQNWNALWESNFSPVVVDDFAGVRAHFHPPNTVVKYDLVITPKMSFGTGHHATTRQMISLMRELPIAGARVFDFGTGTGVLAILAAKMGAAEVEAIDHDEWSIHNAAENFLANDCGHIFLHLADNLRGIAPAEIVLANINKHIILQCLPDIKALVKPGGYLLLSGLLADDEPDIENGFTEEDFFKIKISELSGWIAMFFRRKGG